MANEKQIDRETALTMALDALTIRTAELLRDLKLAKHNQREAQKIHDRMKEKYDDLLQANAEKTAAILTVIEQRDSALKKIQELQDKIKMMETRL